MNVKPLLESENINLEFARQHEDKIGVILSGGVSDTYQERTTIKLLVEVAGQKKYWRLNKTTIENFGTSWGYESEEWIGKNFKLTVTKVNNKDAVVGIPGQKLG